MPKPALRLIISKEQDTRKHLIATFRDAFKENMGEDDPIPFAREMNAMLAFRVTDELTGEEMVEFPTKEAWQKELDGYWHDEWARDKMSYSFYYFVKNFGKFGNYKRKKPTPKALVTFDTCPECYRDVVPGQPCSHCKEEA